ncbi:glutathione S-transferase family protein [Flagellatimonas centrodinii]|uniref:glutathione S-transferase family protein n=1 Tax=Flagellatimonas centrodinii TaxID=2806210 RepID=UPI001FEEDBA4|nr:glutathione S-transferase family protein [Flagellatimonas centrodinii]ULQ47500.1 glutathione S-transferase family protein [Flagellatimonas centrodinii]
MNPIRLYGMRGSGNCWKPAALMQHLGIAFDWVEIDIVNGGSRTPAFLAMNPNGKVPLLEVDGRYLAESNAMLCYLAEGSPLWPTERWQRARVLEWLFFEQYSHEPGIATVRYWIKYLGKGEAWAEKITATRVRGYAALTVMEQQLARTPWLTGDAPTIADIALAAYTHVADEGGFDLGRYPAIEVWLQRLFALPGITPMRA